MQAEGHEDYTISHKDEKDETTAAVSTFPSALPPLSPVTNVLQAEIDWGEKKAR